MKPDSAMAAAVELVYSVRGWQQRSPQFCPAMTVKWAAIIRKHQAQEIGELVDKVRRIQNYLKEANGQDAYGLDMDVAIRNALSEVESLLSRYQKV